MLADKMEKAERSVSGSITPIDEESIWTEESASSSSGATTPFPGDAAAVATLQLIPDPADESIDEGEGEKRDGDDKKKTEDDKTPKPPKKPAATMMRVMKLMKEERWLLLASTGALAVSSIAELGIPLFMGNIIDAVTNEDHDAGLRSLGSAVLLLVVVMIISAVFQMIRTSIYNVAGNRLVARLRRDLFRAIIIQEIGFFDESRTGELTNRLSADTEVIQGSVAYQVPALVRNIAITLIGTIFLFVVSWKLTLVMLAIIPAISIGAVAYGKYMRKFTIAVQEALAKAAEIAEESFSNVRTVRAFAQEDKAVSQYDTGVTASYKLSNKRALGWGGFSGTIGLMAQLAVAGVLYYGGYLVLKGEMTTGRLTSFILFTLTVAVAFGVLAATYGEIMKAVGASERVFSLIDRDPRVNCKGGKTLDRVEGHVKLNDVYFNYPSRPDSKVLKGVTLDLTPGKVVALVGPSGQGKSTVVSLIERFYDPTGGAVTLDGHNLVDLDPAWLRQQIGLVSQEPVLFACSIAENISYGRPGASMEDIINAAKMANAHNFISKFKTGYETLVGERGVRLSGGQKQRVAIARAILMDPRILLLDEATSALDSESEHLVQEALERLMKSRTVLIVAHRLSTVKNADMVAVVSKGTIAERGTHDELIAKNGLYKKLVSRQLQQMH